MGDAQDVLAQTLGWHKSHVHVHGKCSSKQPSLAKQICLLGSLSNLKQPQRHALKASPVNSRAWIESLDGLGKSSFQPSLRQGGRRVGTVEYVQQAQTSMAACHCPSAAHPCWDGVPENQHM